MTHQTFSATVKLNPLNTTDLSRRRTELMGLAMLAVMLFHAPLTRASAFWGLRRVGNVGVDVFLFLSGVGLWYAWTKRPTLAQYFRRRYRRIYPAWIIVALLFYVPRYIMGEGHSTSLVDLAGDVLINWDFWLNDEGTFWYVPAIMMLYTLAPAYLMAIERWPSWRWLPVGLMVWCAAVQWVAPIHAAVGHIEIFWSRMPIFFIGINMGAWVKAGRTADGGARSLLALLFVGSLALSVYIEATRGRAFPLFAERMLYIPLTVSVCLLFPTLLDLLPRWANAAFRLVGTLSLEIYLLHAQFVLQPLSKLQLGYWPTFLLTLALTLPLAWVLHWGIERVMASPPLPPLRGERGSGHS